MEPRAVRKTVLMVLATTEMMVMIAESMLYSS
jgi:hypothetical protein